MRKRRVFGKEERRQDFLEKKKPRVLEEKRKERLLEELVKKRQEFRRIDSTKEGLSKALKAEAFAALAQRVLEKSLQPPFRGVSRAVKIDVEKLPEEMRLKLILERMRKRRTEE